MLDYDDVLLLPPAWPGAVDPSIDGSRASESGPGGAPGRIELTIYPFREPAGKPSLALLREGAARAATDPGARILAGPPRL